LKFQEVLMSVSTANDVRFDTSRGERLLSDEPTIELVIKAREGDRDAVEAILQRCLPRLTRWAHGRLPAAARVYMDTGDLVQETALHVLKRLDHFEVRHVGAMQGYLRQSVVNAIRDAVRRIGRRPEAVELPEDLRSVEASPLETTIRVETYQRYRDALAKLRPRDRELIISRIDLQWTLVEITEHFGLSPDAARRAMTRALRRLEAVL
jgi:RNA polymerase sigma-70 factor (ECF subfamily)